MARNLTFIEIEDILSCIKPNPRIPEEVDSLNKENVKNIMRKQFQKIKIYPEKIQELKDKVENYYLKTQVAAGEMVGVLAATSIGEPTTQLALNSFHSSGISKSTMTTGVPRIEALLNAYKNLEDNSGMYLYLKDVDYNDIKQIREVCMENYEYKLLKDITDEIRIIKTEDLPKQTEYIENESSWEDWHDYYDLMVSEDYKECDWCVFIKVKKLELYLRKKTLSEIASIIESKNENIYAICSGEEEGIIIVYVDTSEVKAPNEVIGLKKKSKKIDEELTLEGLITNENKDYYYVRDIVVPSLSNLYICGVKGIDGCYFDQSFGQKKEWKIETRGSNFRDVLNHPMTDHTRTLSSNMWEIYEVLGIEATRTFLLDEFLRIVAVSKRHIVQLVNMMTFFGIVRGANRHGVNNTQVKTLAKITFEEPLKHLKHASMTSETDYLSNISSQLMIGRVCKAGTGIVNLVMDNTKFFNKEEKKEEKKYENVEDMEVRKFTFRKKKLNDKTIGVERKEEKVSSNEPVDVKLTDTIMNNMEKSDVIKKKKQGKEMSLIEGKTNYSKKLGQVKSRIFKNLDENNISQIKEKNIEYL